MMDWTDDLKSSFCIKSLGLLENACHLYGTSNFECLRPLAENDNPSVPRALECSYAMVLRELPVIGAELLRRGRSEAVVMGAAATALAPGHRVLEYLRDLNGFEPGKRSSTDGGSRRRMPVTLPEIACDSRAAC